MDEISDDPAATVTNKAASDDEVETRRTMEEPLRISDTPSPKATDVKTVSADEPETQDSGKTAAELPIKAEVDANFSNQISSVPCASQPCSDNQKINTDHPNTIIEEVALTPGQGLPESDLESRTKRMTLGEKALPLPAKYKK